MKKLFTLLSLFCILTSCDVWRLYTINGKEKEIINSNCGILQISPNFTVMAPFQNKAKTLNISFKLDTDGSFDVFPDSLQIETYPKYTNKTISVVFLAKNGDTYTLDTINKINDFSKEKKINLSGGKRIGINYHFEWDKKIDIKHFRAIILPSEFIKCYNKNVLTDTLTIQ